jgi:hypothetical protein
MFLINYIKKKYENYKIKKNNKIDKDDKELNLIVETYIEDKEYIYCYNKDDDKHIKIY